MNKLPVILLLIFLTLLSCCNTEQVLIIQDEKPQMEVLSRFLQEKGGLDVQIADQENLPQDLTPCKAVIVFIHGELFPETERAVIDYTKNGGRCIVLHHSISSGKAKNEFYFDFLGIRLDSPEKSRFPVEPGAGYGWVDPVTLTIVNLNSNHYVTSHNITWEDQVLYTPSDNPGVEALYPCLSLDSSEVYMNHKFIDGREKTVLCGIKFLDERNGQLFMQDRGAWIKDQGKGKIFYFQPGHRPEDYKNNIVSQMILNAIEWVR
ncbi:ThuA domain-containing protein [candidate division KSB1 bacterium]|nr:ThuA domain-containing protein [candidate division KSB1 bacterium]